MAIFTRFGSDVDESTAKLLRKGECLTELLKQGKGDPLNLFKQVAILLAYKLDVFENVPKKEIKLKANELIELLIDQYPEYVNEINQTGDITDAVEKIFTKTMLEFKQ